MHNRIKAKSIELFYKKGYAGTSVRDITNSLNITPAALYAHFSSKSDLFLQDLSEGWDIISKGVDLIIEKNIQMPRQNKLHEIYRYYLSFYMNERFRTIFVIRNTMFPPEELRDEVYDIFFEKTIDVNKKIADLFIKLMEQNVIKELEVNMHMSIFYRLVNSFLFELTVFNKQLTAEELDNQWESYWLSIKK